MLISLFPALAVLAEDGAGEFEQPWRLGGFGTLGGAWSSVDTYEFRRDATQAPTGVSGGAGSASVDSRLGLQLNYRLSPEWEAVAQGLVRYRYDASWRPELSWGFLSYTPDAALSLRAGRLGLDIYPLSDSANVGYSYLTVRPPPDYYGGIPMQSFDGADISYTWPLGADVVRAKAYLGAARGKAPADPQGGVFVLDGSPIAGAYLEYLSERWTARLGYSRIEVAEELPFPEVFELLRHGGIPGGPALAEQLAVKDKRYGYWAAALGYQDGPLQTQFAGSVFSSDSYSLPDYYAGFAQIGYRLGAFTPYGYISAAHSPDAPPASGLPPWPVLAPLEDAVARMIESNMNDVRSYALGVRWDFAQNFALKAQVERIRGTHSLVLWVVPPGMPQPFQTTVLSATVDFAF
ncbi:hypothetical protein OPU71_01135 [Niveibacterium sp. 24ML]|uniref:hypothetical protein n=1 Tax=Niveibacterium sp. 24ML TaxID=2985512 RepID=UPI00226D9082|nr:hypothetical protein [Niveibacterium sp. 24ML]MCX9154723.1 hypothetical protein [Niveibacterium sp. 24ML]